MTAATDRLKAMIPANGRIAAFPDFMGADESEDEWIVGIPRDADWVEGTMPLTWTEICVVRGKRLADALAEVLRELVSV